MKKLTLNLHLLFYLFLVLSVNLVAQNAKTENIHIYPYLQYATPTSMIVKWETKTASIGTVSYSEDQNFKNKKEESTPVKIHEIKLINLNPETTYHYKVSFDNTTLASASFTTAPKKGTRNWRMVAYGDNRSQPKVHEKIVEQILKLNPSMIIHSGDLVASGDNYEHWKEQYFDPMKNLSDKICVYPSLGNHERNSHYYYDYMSVPDENGESYYSFDYGNAHFIALNSNEDEEDFDKNSKQTKWLIKDLQQHKDAEWKIVFFHHPLFRCHPRRGIEAQRWIWQDVFEKYGVDLVVNGHDHYYQRTYAIGNYQGKPSRGVYHLISGGGGAPNYPIVPKVHAAYRRSVHHITVMDFLGDRIVGRAIDGEGNIFDAFVYDKEAENSAEEFIAYEIYKIERDLAEAIIKMPVANSNNKGAKLKDQININNPFTHPLLMTYSWEADNNWQTSKTITQVLQAGQSIKLPINISAKKGDIFPLPKAKLHFQTPEGKLAFKNNTIFFSPVKIWKSKTVKASVQKTTPTIDGNLSEVKWKSKKVLSDFTDAAGDKKPTRKTEILIKKTKNGDGLYIVGKLAASTKMAKSGTDKQDHYYILRGEHIQIHIGVGKEVYSYLVNPKGSLLDAKNKNPEWDSTAKTAASTNANGWQFEINIPLSELNIQSQATTINFVRNDDENDEQSEFILTYGQSDLDHRIPMYETDIMAVQRFAILML